MYLVSVAYPLLSRGEVEDGERATGEAVCVRLLKGGVRER